MTRRHRFILGLLLTAAASSAADDSGVKVWETKVVISTYLAGDPEPNPMFFFGRESQGAQGPVYPYPMYDTLTGKKVDKTYTIVYLENEYIRIGVLPEVGGRIFEGVDRTNNYNFIYRQHVIKPALIGLIGAWISGRPCEFPPPVCRAGNSDSPSRRAGGLSIRCVRPPSL